MIYYQKTLDKLYAATGYFSHPVGQFSDRFGAKLQQISLVGSSLNSWACKVCRFKVTKEKRAIDDTIDRYKVTIQNIVTLQRRAEF